METANFFLDYNSKTSLSSICRDREINSDETICKLTSTELASLSLILTVPPALGYTPGWVIPPLTPCTDEKAEAQRLDGKAQSIYLNSFVSKFKVITRH